MAKKYYSRDGEHRIALGEVVERCVAALEADGKDAFLDVLDELFLVGAWGHLVQRDRLFARDLRGAMLAFYQAGKAAPRVVERVDFLEDDDDQE